jgi:hypothetical protein
MYALCNESTGFIQATAVFPLSRPEPATSLSYTRLLAFREWMNRRDRRAWGVRERQWWRSSTYVAFCHLFWESHIAQKVCSSKSELQSQSSWTSNATDRSCAKKIYPPKKSVFDQLFFLCLSRAVYAGDRLLMHELATLCTGCHTESFFLLISHGYVVVQQDTTSARYCVQ